MKLYKTNQFKPVTEIEAISINNESVLFDTETFLKAKRNFTGNMLKFLKERSPTRTVKRYKGNVAYHETKKQAEQYVTDKINHRIAFHNLEIKRLENLKLPFKDDQN